MSMPLRFDVSEKPVMIFPRAGQAQSILLSSISGTRADSDLGGGAGAGVTVGGEDGAEAGGAAACGVGSATEGATAADGGGAVCNWASACSEYGNFTALGSVL